MEDKTLREHLTSATKYSGSSVGIGYVLAKIITFTYPNLVPIETEIGAVLTVLANLLVVFVNKK